MLIPEDDIRSSSLSIMLRQIILLLSAVTLTLALGNGRQFQSKKNGFQKQSQFASVASYHSSQPVQAQAPQAQAPQYQAPQIQQAPSPYSFGYEAEGSSRQESADASGKVTGSYKVINEDGTIRVVNYVADEQGFRADIDTNEAGTKTSNPSNVDFKSAFVEPPAPVAAAAPKKYAAKGFSETKSQKAHFEQKPIQFSAGNGGDNGAYSFNYEAQLEDGGSNARSESGDGSGSVSGHYSLSASDGRRRQVDYSSGAQGFQAKIDTNEFGTKSESPAHVQFFSSAPQEESGPAPSAYAQTGSFQQQQKVSTYSTSPVRQEPIQAGFSFGQQQVQQTQYEDKPSPYSFSYDAQLEDGSSSRTESSDGSGKVVGSYSLATADGRQRTIDYEADHAGFRAKVNTNEFGTKSDSPADAHFYSSAPQEAPEFKAAGQQKISAAFPIEQSRLTSNSQIKSTFQPQAASSSSQFKSSFQGQQSAMQYNGGADSYSPYAFNYIAELDDGTSSRSESSDGSGKVVGSYSLSVNDGRKRTVDYLADHEGFRASVNTNEFGTKSDSPADVQFYSTAVQEEPAAAAHQYKSSASAGFSSKTSSASSGFATKNTQFGSQSAFKAAGATQSGFASKSSGSSGFASQAHGSSGFGSQSAFKSAGASQPAAHASGAASFKQTAFSQQRVEEPSYQPSPYAFNYEADASGGSSARKESSDASGKVTGSYTVRNEDGSMRVVEYVADHNGFRANVKTNEHGTKSDNPADVMIKSDAPAVAPSAPIQQQQQQHNFASKANFPDRTYSQKSSMVSQKHIDAWSR